VRRKRCRSPFQGAIAAGVSLASDATLEDGISDGRCLPGSKRHGDR
jgi:hypothetical protein